MSKRDERKAELEAMMQLLRAVQNGGAGKESRRFKLAAHMSAVL